MNIRERALELLQVFAQTPPPTESAKITTLELVLKKVYDTGYEDGRDERDKHREAIEPEGNKLTSEDGILPLP